MPAGDPLTAPATPEAAQWDGWGTSLKPAWEPIIVARKPLIGTVAANVLRYGTGGINVDGCRIETEEVNPSIARRRGPPPINNVWQDKRSPDSYAAEHPGETAGRWPANLIHDGSEEVVALFPESEGGTFRITRETEGREDESQYRTKPTEGTIRNLGDSGSAARFFYCAKPTARERKHGLAFEGVEGSHTTVKPLTLMRYLVRLVTRPDGLVLDPFLGSGTTRLACGFEGMRCVGIEQDEGYCRIAAARG